MNTVSPSTAPPADVVVPPVVAELYRITDPGRSRGFYEALGLEFRRDMDIVCGGEKEVTN